MKKTAALALLLSVFVVGCNSSDNDSSAPVDPIPGNPGLPVLPPGSGGGDDGNDQTTPDNDTDIDFPQEDPLIAEAAHRWGTSYKEMERACKLWTCNLGSVQERMIFSLERDTQNTEGSARVTFTLSESKPDFWASYVFYSELIQNKNVQIESVISNFYYLNDDTPVTVDSVLMGEKTGFDHWSTHQPRDCGGQHCGEMKASILGSATSSFAMAVYRTDGVVTSTQTVYVTDEELQVLAPIFSPTFPEKGW
ncbi:hypothetical protein GT360_09655 [Vibrio astriarenae]|uniref:Lipoprotein n=1 Tax=Vibrio astriarenae TaxID=1481923 RepID=A0A7Z2YDV6_9VIBR|nr:hypothetical protein [Vibrio astriarenae]QIA63768.1 hypothetical protein GT360_09655 [Vibrio astriarenae]